MLLEFTIKNFLSYKDEVCFDMNACSTVKECESKDGYYSNVTYVDETRKPQRILRTAAIYGANGSGKSTILDAINLFKTFVINSFNDEDIIEDLSNSQYAFNSDCKIEPISMEMVYLDSGTRYRIGFEVYEGKVITEWLFIQKPTAAKESYCFKRQENNIVVNSKEFKGGKGVIEKTRGNALFISTAAFLNVEIASRIRAWFRDNIRSYTTLSDTIDYTASKFKDDIELSNKIIGLIQNIDPCIKKINVVEDIVESTKEDTLPPVEVLSKLGLTINPEEASKTVKHHELSITSYHDSYNKDVIEEKSMPFIFESLGTKKIFGLLGPIFFVLKNGGTLIIDEFGSSLHTQLSIEIIKLFYSPFNTNGAQLIFATHDVNLLRKELLRRDQIWFTEKSNKGESDLYSLVEYKINQANSVRNDASFAKDYLAGRYGAIPHFGDIQNFILDYCK